MSLIHVTSGSRAKPCWRLFMKILVVNSGSSSLKYNLFEMDTRSILFTGLIDRIGLEDAIHSFQDETGHERVTQSSASDHGQAIDEMFTVLLDYCIGNLEEIPAVAHRVVHGGRFKRATIITQEVMEEVCRMVPFFPLHHPPQIVEIEECVKRIPSAIHVAVFDTSFHATIPDVASIYGLPYRYFSEKYYRRTGFHGNSHEFVSQAAADFLGKPLSETKIITCHLGNGCSLAAIDGGKSVDTTLGMTACEGLIMGTRCGDVDPGLMPVIMLEEKLSPDDILEMLYNQSGLLGISGVSRDMREIEASAAEGNERSKLALDAFCYRVKRYIGAFLAVLGGCDALVFTGGIGLNSVTVRSKSLEGLSGLGFKIDEQKNSGGIKPTALAPVTDYSEDDSPIRILVARTFEELIMARQCLRVMKSCEED